jgi:DNA-binding IclR family transcriptional regulator
LLVTSKEPLPGLEHLHLEALSPEDAQAFLRAKAPAVGSLAPDADTLYPIAERCGCLPLPLRLAGSALAGRARTPPDVVYPQEYLARLEEARKQKGPLDAALDLSYEMLSADLRHKWRTLAVFPTTFAREAAAAVWDVDAGAARAALEALVEGGLVERGEAAGRYRLHDLLAERVQQYVEGEEGTQARRRYARYYAQVTEDAARVGGWRGQKILNQERIHIEAAQGWAERSAPRDPVAVHVCSQFITARGGCMAVGLNVPPRLGVQASPTFGWGTQRALPSWEELEALSPEELRRLQEALRRRLGAD